jgi:hypothetical protein
VAWNIRNYRYVGGVSASLYEKAMDATVAGDGSLSISEYSLCSSPSA